MGGGGGKITPCLKPVRIVLETSNLTRKQTPLCSFRKYTFQCLGLLTFVDVSIFLPKNSVFCPKKYLYSKQFCEGCVRDILVLFSVLVRHKITVTGNRTFADSVHGIRPSDCSEVAKNPKNNNDVTIFRHDVNVNFDVVLFLLSSLVTDPSFISISSLVLELWQFSFIRD